MSRVSAFRTNDISRSFQSRATLWSGAFGAFGAYKPAENDADPSCLCLGLIRTSTRRHASRCTAIVRARGSQVTVRHYSEFAHWSGVSGVCIAGYIFVALIRAGYRCRRCAIMTTDIVDQTRLLNCSPSVPAIKSPHPYPNRVELRVSTDPRAALQLSYQSK